MAPEQAYRVQVGTDNEWTVAELWNLGPISAADTAVTYAGGTLEDGHTYYVRVQVYNGLQWSPWKVSQFRMNTPPTTPTGLTPDNMAGMASATPVLQCSNASDNDGDNLTYAFEVYSDSLMTVLVAQTSGRPHGTGITTWTVTPALTDDQEYFWRTQASDGFETGPWSQRGSFWVNSVNQPPVAFDLAAPADDSVMTDPQPTFVWHASGDTDLHDAVHYRLFWADNPEFTGADSSGVVADTTYTMPESLALGNVYSWKVQAYDLFGGVTPAQSVNSLTMWLFGDANSDGKITVGDAVFIISYIFRGGPAPTPLRVGDVNGDCKINSGDAVYIISYLFRSGAHPVQGCR
jgi:hypothetical protein